MFKVDANRRLQNRLKTIAFFSTKISNLVYRAFSLALGRGGAGKGPGIDWSRVHLTP